MATRPLICFYGDDFTGSTDSFAQFQRFQLKGALLTKLPSENELKDIARSVDVLGIAGLSRSMPVAELDRELRTVFGALAELGPRLIQYKVCSTFDSSKITGNIGRACEIALEMFPDRPIGVAVAQPDFGRYTLFGHHFARAGDGRVYRLDRHPTMASHPVTPMKESCLRLNLIEQAERLMIREVHLPDLNRGHESKESHWLGAESRPHGAVVFDALTNADLERIAELIWTRSTRNRPAFCIGSGGISYGIASFLARGATVEETGSLTMKPVAAMLAVSGSCSNQTAEQINQAVSMGWMGIRIDPLQFNDVSALNELEESVVASLSVERSVIVYTALGRPDSQETDVVLIGSCLAQIVERSLKRTAIRRLIVAGGDTSGYVMRALPVTALRLGARIIENAVMCMTTSTEPWFDKIELMLKGGQVGDRGLFERVRMGLAVR